MFRQIKHRVNQNGREKRAQACFEAVQKVLKRHGCELKAAPGFTEDGRVGIVLSVDSPENEEHAKTCFEEVNKVLDRYHFQLGAVPGFTEDGRIVPVVQLTVKED